MSPFEALYGYPPPTVKEYVINTFKVLAVENYLATSDEVICILKSRLEQARNHMKQQADTKRTDREFEVGAWVFVRLQPYKQTNLKTPKIINLCQGFMDHIKEESRTSGLCSVHTL